MSYSHKIYPLEPLIWNDKKKTCTQNAAEHLEQLVSKAAQQGWSFFQMDPIDVFQPAGCLGLIQEKSDRMLPHSWSHLGNPWSRHE